MKVIDIISLNENNKYDHYTVISSKSFKSLINDDTTLTDNFYNFIINTFNIPCKRPKSNTRAIVKDLSKCIKY